MLAVIFITHLWLTLKTKNQLSFIVKLKYNIFPNSESNIPPRPTMQYITTTNKTQKHLTSKHMPN